MYMSAQGSFDDHHCRSRHEAAATCGSDALVIVPQRSCRQHQRAQSTRVQVCTA
jgi:hypothetical protein